MSAGAPADDHFQQAKTEGSSSPFLQIVAKPEPAAAAKSKPKPGPKLTRVAFKVSRLMKFCSKRELQNQTGHAVLDWPLVVGKELMDNALDAAEEAVGTRMTIKWPPDDDLAECAEDRFKQLIASYVWFNPHLTLRGVWFGQEFVNLKATNPNWEKWRPRNPTSPHWYDESRLQRYLAAHVARDRDLGQRRTVREFIAEFRGLSGSAVGRKILEEVGCSHQSVAQFFGIEQVNRSGIAKLLAAMKRNSKPVAPKHLGVIGVEHLRLRFLAAGGNSETFKYECRKGLTPDGIPYVVEFAFGLHQSGLSKDGHGVPRKFITGANWSVGISNPFRAFGSTGEGLESTLAKVRANSSAPVICALHLASAYIQYADRGKSSIILIDNAEQPDE